MEIWEIDMNKLVNEIEKYLDNKDLYHNPEFIRNVITELHHDRNLIKYKLAYYDNKEIHITITKKIKYNSIVLSLYINNKALYINNKENGIRDEYIIVDKITDKDLYQRVSTFFSKVREIEKGVYSEHMLHL